MIRQYQPGDTDALVALWRRANALAHPFLKKAFVAQVAQDMRDVYLPNAETWVSVRDAAPIGFIALIGSDIGGLFVDPDHHGHGHGRALADHGAALHGPLRVEVFAQNTLGRRFYDRYGFVETGRYQHAPSGEMTLQMAMPAV